MAKERPKILSIILYVLLILFSIFIIYQLIIKILGGSWETQDIIIALLILIIGFIFNITVKLTKIETNFNNLKNSFCNLAKDFKQHLSNNQEES